MSSPSLFSPEPTQSHATPGTPLTRPTEKAVKLAQDGLEQAEALEAQGFIHEAAVVKAAALMDAAALYARGKKARRRSSSGGNDSSVNFHIGSERSARSARSSSAARQPLHLACTV